MKLPNAPGLPPPCIVPQGWPLLVQAVPAGIPSPADDRSEIRLSLDEHLIDHPDATFFVRVQGHSMTGFGIHDGDLLVVDRARAPVDRSIVIAVVDGAFTVKQVCRLPEGVLLRANGGGQCDILVGAEQTLEIWGVVTDAIHHLSA